MAGDRLHIKVDYYVPSATTNNNNANGLNSIITALTTLINADPVTTPFHGSGGTITTSLNSSTSFTSFISPENGTGGTTLPKAYLNIVFFDEQFKFVSTNSEAVQITTEGSGQTIYRVDGNAKAATKNGYVYIYVSNESNNLVYFDNLQITHEHGALLQEDHYYPYGSGMAGISSKAVSGIIVNAYKANGGAEYGDGEWSNGTGLEMYETFYRSYNAQAGRFLQADPLAESSINISSYAFGMGNPVNYVDPNGDRGQAPGRGPLVVSNDLHATPDWLKNSWANYFADPINYNTNLDYGGGDFGYSDDGFTLYGGAAQSFIVGLQNAIKRADDDGNWTFTVRTNEKGELGYWSWDPFTAPAANGMLEVVGFNHTFVHLDDGDGTKNNPYNGPDILLACYEHYQSGQGTNFYVNTDCLDFTGIGQDKFNYDKNDNISINLFNTKYLTQTGLAIGKVGLKAEGNDWFSLQSDRYDFNMEKGLSLRNLYTGIDWILHHLTIFSFGESFNIIFTNPVHIPKIATPFEPPN